MNIITDGKEIPDLLWRRRRSGSDCHAASRRDRGIRREVKLLEIVKR